MTRGLLKTNEGLPVFLLGLSDENVRRLKNGEPIRIDLDEMTQGEFLGQVIIHHGVTEEAMAEELAKHLGVKAQEGL